MQFSTMKTELSDRGFDQLSDTRLGQFINQGRAELDNMYPWPYRLTTASGAAPLTVTDLGVIDEVTNTLTPSLAPLEAADRVSLRERFGDITIAGVPWFYYVDGTAVKTYPVGGSLFVRYFKRCPMLSAAADTPLAPADYHLLIVDLACRWAQKDGEQPASLDADIQRQVGVMVSDLFGMQASTGPVASQSILFASGDW